MKTLITRIKRLALALCFVTPLVSWAAAVGDTVTWTNADGLTADDVVNANHCSFDFCIPGTEALPNGSVVRITKVEIASINETRTTNSSTTDKLNDPYYVSISAVRSDECQFVTSETLAGKYIDSFTFTSECNITIGKNYPNPYWGGTYTATSGWGMMFLFSNGNRWSGGDRMDCTVGGTTSGVIKNGNIYPIYRITAEVVSIHKDVEVSSNTTASAINEMVGTATDVSVTVAGGVTITIDAAFNTAIKSVSSAGTVTLSAETQPDLSGVSFNVQGALLRSWLTPGVVGFNFRNNSGGDTSGALAAGTWASDGNSANGSSTAIFADGLSTLTWSSGGTWASGSGTILSGYLDDGSNKGNGAEVYLSNVPYETYDVIIYCNSDSNPGYFLAKTVNGTTYTWDTASGSVVEGNSTWGKAALATPVYGVNALRVKNLSGALTIYGTPRNGSYRGGIAAIQIMPPETPDNIRTYKLTLDGTATTWSEGTWTLNNQTVEAPTAGYVEIVASESTEVTVDTAVSVASLTIAGEENVVVTLTNGAGSLSAITTTVAGGVLKQGTAAVLGAGSIITVEDGATLDLYGVALGASSTVKIAGDGAGSWPWALTSSSGEFPASTLTAITLTGDATIGGANKINFGKSGEACTLDLGGYTLTKTGAGELAFTNGRCKSGATGTFDISEGLVSLNQYCNLDGSKPDGQYANTTVILRDGAELKNVTDRAIVIDTLQRLGGSITGTKPFAITTAFEGAGSVDQLWLVKNPTVTLTGDLTVGTLTLETVSGYTEAAAPTLAKGAAVEGSATFTVSGTVSGNGVIAVGAGVTPAFTGAGDVTAKLSYSANPGELAFTKLANWKGTIVPKWAGDSNTAIPFNSYGTAASFVEVLEGDTLTGYIPSGTITNAPTLVVSGTYNNANGFNKSTVVWKKIKGNGTLSLTFAPKDWMAATNSRQASFTSSKSRFAPFFGKNPIKSLQNRILFAFRSS